MSNPDRAIEHIARRQHGAFNIDQAKAVELTYRMVERRVRSGAWVRKARGVYVLASAPTTWPQTLMCAVISEPDAAVSGRPACAVHQLTGFRPTRPELVVPSNANHRSRLATIRRSDDVEKMVVDRIPVVTPMQALFDVAGSVPPRMLRRAAEDALLRNLIRPDELIARYEHLAPQRNRGIGEMRSIVEALCDPAFVPPASELEALLFELLDEIGLPHLRQFAFPWRAPTAMIVDAIVPSLRLIVEADGRSWHSQVAAIHNDRTRDRVAMANGYDTMRLSHPMLTSERAATVADLRTYVARRRRSLDAMSPRARTWPAA